jgi:hypothetical protein
MANSHLGNITTEMANSRKRLRRLKGDNVRFKIGVPQMYWLVRHSRLTRNFHRPIYSGTDHRTRAFCISTIPYIEGCAASLDSQRPVSGWLVRFGIQLKFGHHGLTEAQAGMDWPLPTVPARQAPPNSIKRFKSNLKGAAKRLECFRFKAQIKEQIWLVWGVFGGSSGVVP